jgi:hypothetical protein
MLNEEGVTIDAWERIDALAKENPPRSLITSRDNNVYQTVYNFNYLSFYLSVVIPVFVMLFILCRSITQKAAAAVMCVLLFINMCAANATGGFLGLFAAFAAAVITFRTHIIKWRYQLLIIIVLAGGTFVLSDWYMRHMSRYAISRQVSDQVAEGVSKRESREKIDQFITNEESIVVSVRNNELKIPINRDSGRLVDTVHDSRGARVDTQVEEVIIIANGNEFDAAAISFTDTRFKDLTIIIPGQGEDLYRNDRMCIINLENDKKYWWFLITQEEIRCVTDWGSMIKLRKVPHIGFEQNPAFGTGRGYIWSRTFPLMRDTLLIGHGADTYAMIFPHDDLPGLYYDYGIERIIFDKPHNFILINFVNTGGLSAAAIIAVIIIYIIQSFKLYSKSIEYDIYTKIGTGIYLGIIAFLVSGIAYDSTVNVMPLIYGLLGIGICCNYFVKAARVRQATA